MRNGIAPKKLKTNQNIATIKNPSRILICDLSFYLESMQGGLQKKLLKKIEENYLCSPIKECSAYWNQYKQTKNQ